MGTLLLQSWKCRRKKSTLLLKGIFWWHSKMAASEFLRFFELWGSSGRLKINWDLLHSNSSSFSSATSAAWMGFPSLNSLINKSENCKWGNLVGVAWILYLLFLLVCNFLRHVDGAFENGKMWELAVLLGILFVFKCVFDSILSDYTS